MSGPALFQLDANGAIVAERPARLFPCGLHDTYLDEREHIVECLRFTCPDCGIRGGDWGVIEDVEAYKSMHGAPGGWMSGFCLMQRTSWERVAECIVCRCFWRGRGGCPNRACALFVPEPAVTKEGHHG